ncbi:MAG: ATP synthase subunit I, partial [Bradymonadaceae bacterium]
GLVWKTLVVGALAAVVVGWLTSPALGVSVMAGAGLAAGNAWALSWLGRKILASPPEETGQRRRAAAFWAVLLGVKLVALLVMAYLVIVLFGVDPLGLAIGYTAFVLATGWQTFESFGADACRD